LARRMGWRPMQAARARNRPISPQPEGQCSFRAVCGVAALAHSGAMGCAPRLASHPEKSAARHQIIYGQVLKLMAFFKFRWPGQKGQEVKAKPARSSRAAPAESIETMRRRARHRLIGAAVLVLLGVVGFPLLFDSQPRPIPVDIPIEIPDRNRVAPLVAPSAQGGSAQEAAAAPASAAPAAAPARAPEAASAPAPAPATATATATATAVHASANCGDTCFPARIGTVAQA
jgi:hypothetical protein